MDESDLLERLLAAHDIRFCVIGGQAVNIDFPGRARLQRVLGMDQPFAK